MPRSESGLTCRSCYSKQKGGGGQSSAPAPEMNTASEPAPFDVPDDAVWASEPMPSHDYGGAVPVTPGDKPRFAGDWKCAGCDSAITSLPFQPRDTSNLKCIDCFKKSKG
jgi:hypothetical protein